MTTPDYRFTGNPEGNPHERAINIDADSPHHTLGKGTTQAAAGDHKHVAKDITDLTEPDDVLTDHQLLSNRGDTDAHTQYSKTNHVHASITDHGELGGLGDDDHAAYPTKTGGRASGTWPINITGNAGAVDGQSFAWSDPGVIPTYFWGASNNGSSYLIWTGRLPQKSVHNFGTVTAGSQKRATFTKRAEQVPFCTVDHKSTYLLANVETLSTTSFAVEIRNSTNGTDHTNCLVNILLVQ